MKLKYQIKKVSEITAVQQDEMFELMENHYENVHLSEFLFDLSEKQWVILLLTQEDKIVGFSTQVLIFPEDSSEFSNSIVLFSGDTIISHEHWGSVTLPVAFLHLVNTIQDAYPTQRIFWMLISKGLRTFKFLSVFLKEYYPCHFTQTPQPIHNLMQYMGNRKFGERYKAERGIIEAVSNGQFLKEEFQPQKTLDNAVAKFFYSSNPGFYKGDELLCMAEIAEDNLHPFIKRMVSRYV